MYFLYFGLICFVYEFLCTGCDETPVGCRQNVTLSPQDVASIGRQIAVEMSMSGSGKKKKKYSRSNLLSKKMLSLHHLYPDFVSGSECGQASYFFCKICHRDVSMASHGSGEFDRHFRSDSHWKADVTYRVHTGLPVYNKLMEKMSLSEEQMAEFRNRPFVDMAEGYPFPEDLLPKHSKPESKVPFMTMISCLCELLRGGGDFSTLRRLWGLFRVTLPETAPQYHVNWSRSETLVSIPICVTFYFVVVFLVLFPARGSFWCCFLNFVVFCF